MSNYDRDIDELRKHAVAQGWRYDTANTGHHRFYGPDKHTIVTFASTPSDWRGYQNSLSEMKRAGYRPPNGSYTPPTLADAMPKRPQAEPTHAEKETAGRGEVLNAVLATFRNNAGRALDLDTIAIQARTLVPITTRDSVQQTLIRITGKDFHDGTIQRMERGMYKWRPKVEPPPPPPTPAPVAPPVQAAPPTEPGSVDDDIAELDEALAALGRIESLVRRNREVMKQFRELKAMLDKIGIKT